MLTHTQHPRSRTKSRLKKQRSITTTITTTLTMAPPKVTITTRRTTLRRRHDPCPRRRPVAQHSLPRLERRDPLLLDDSLPTAQVRQNLTYTHVRSGSCIGTNAWSTCAVSRWSFHADSELPAPPPFRNIPKNYPSGGNGGFLRVPTKARPEVPSAPKPPVPTAAKPPIRANSKAGPPARPGTSSHAHSTDAHT